MCCLQLNPTRVDRSKTALSLCRGDVGHTPRPSLQNEKILLGKITPYPRGIEEEPICKQRKVRESATEWNPCIGKLLQEVGRISNARTYGRKEHRIKKDTVQKKVSIIKKYRWVSPKYGACDWGFPSPQECGVSQIPRIREHIYIYIYICIIYI